MKFSPVFLFVFFLFYFHSGKTLAQYSKKVAINNEDGKPLVALDGNNHRDTIPIAAIQAATQLKVVSAESGEFLENFRITSFNVYISLITEMCG